ncbi:MAG: TonB-dependent receptor [Bacteroidota bacterium]
MRFSFTQFVIALLTISCLNAMDSDAQEILEQKISVSAEKIQLKVVLLDIENQANVNFTYSSKKISTNQKVSLLAENQSLNEVLVSLLSPLSIDFKVFNERTIVLTKMKNQSTGSLDFFAPVKGQVTDDDGNPLIGASVFVKGTSTGVVTDVNGNYSIDCPESGVLVFSYTGYQDKEVTCTGDATMNVTLSEGIDLEGVTVIGSRGKPRTDLDSPVPIDAIQAADLAKTGQPDIGQSIHFTVPSFSAQKFGINDLAPLIDPAQLRGLGSDQTLLLVNGKRRHKVAFFNGNDGVGKGQLGNDINSIPSAAVERVEVLRDGAAAQYGSDAIAGVVNMELKKARSGGSFSAYIGSTFTSPKYDDITNRGEEGEKIYGDDAITDGNTFKSSINFGLPWGEDGFLNTTVHFQHSDPTDRSGTYSHSTGWYVPEQFDPLGLTDEQLQAQNGIDLDRAVLGTAENTNGGIFLNAGKPINDTWSYYGMGGFTKKQIIGGVFSRSPARTSRAVLEIFPDGYNPEVPSRLTDWQILSGFTGEFSNDWNLDFSMGYSGNDVQLFARNTVNPSMGADSPTQFYTGGLRVTQSLLNLDITKSLTESISLAFGSEYRRETYELMEGEKESWFPGSLATEGRDIGSSGREGFTPASSGFWDRTNIGVYAEVEADVTKDLLLVVAGRFENYSDFGSDFSYKAAARYKILDNYSIRASVNRSFRAPALAQTHYSNFSQISFDSDGGSIVSPTLPIRDNRVQSAFGIDNLEPETSLDFAVGATAKFLDGAFKLTVDAYQIAVDDRIFLAQVAAADFTEFATSGFDDINFFANAINTTTQGLDIVATYKKRFAENSVLNLSLAINFNSTEIDELNVTPELAPHISFDRTNNASDFFIYLIEGTPKNKIIFTPSYRIGKLSLLARISSFGKVSEPRLRFNADINEWDDNPPGGGEPQVLASKAIMDFSITGHITDNLSITGGVNNLFDTYPDMLREGQVRGEVIYSRRVNQFGTNGRFINLSLNYSWK